MTLTTLAGVDVELNEGGFLVDPDQGTADMAVELARKKRIDPLTEQHWQGIRFMRSGYVAKGTGSKVRVLGKTSGVSIKELYQLFPRDRPRSPPSRNPAVASAHRQKEH